MAGGIRGGSVDGCGCGDDDDDNARFTAALISATPEDSGDASSEDESLVSGDSLGPKGVR